MVKKYILALGVCLMVSPLASAGTFSDSILDFDTTSFKRSAPLVKQVNTQNQMFDEDSDEEQATLKGKIASQKNSDDGDFGSTVRSFLSAAWNKIVSVFSFFN